MCVCPHTLSAFEPVGRLGCAERSFFFPSSQCPLFICRNAFGGLEAVAVEEGLGDEGERLLYMFAHTPIYVSSYSYIFVLILLYICPHTPICVLILLYMQAALWCWVTLSAAPERASSSHCSTISSALARRSAPRASAMAVVAPQRLSSSAFHNFFRFF